MKKICLLFALLFFLAARSYGQETKTFTGSGLHFNYSIDYPSDWQAGDIYGFAQIISPLESNSDNFKENIVITVADISKKPRTLEDFNNLVLTKIIPQELGSFTLLEQEKTTIDGKETLVYVYKGTKEGDALKYKRYSFKNNSSIYELTFEAEYGKFDQYLPKAENIIASIKVK